MLANCLQAKGKYLYSKGQKHNIIDGFWLLTTLWITVYSLVHYLFSWQNGQQPQNIYNTILLFYSYDMCLSFIKILNALFQYNYFKYIFIFRLRTTPTLGHSKSLWTVKMCQITTTTSSIPWVRGYLILRIAFWENSNAKNWQWVPSESTVLKYPKSFHPSVTMQFGKVIAQCNNWNGTVNYYYYFPY